MKLDDPSRRCEHCLKWFVVPDLLRQHLYVCESAKPWG